MIRYLENREVDRIKWDVCMENSTQPLIYGISWYLDLVAPGWCALVNEDYSAVMPLPVKSRYGIQYCIQPIYAQQLGIFSNTELNSATIHEFLEAIPRKFKIIKLNLNSQNFLANSLPGEKKNTNYILSLENIYEMILDGYSANTRRNIQKASGLNISFDGSIDDLIRLKTENTALGRKRVPSGLISAFIKGVMDKAAGFICSASWEGEICASVFFIHYKKRIYYLIPVSNSTGKERKAMFAIIDIVIQKFSGSQMILDFEGSNIQGLARFFEGFGAEKTFYPGITINRLPFPLNKFLKS
ncbi:MAG: hypothetical protein H6540_02650 [Bacteroidales bacterium]|nr:hypothetical protein [Bacteroidales bacterium]